MARIWGHAGGDDLVGTTGDDTFNLWQGGNDDVSGDAGNDDFRFRETFNSSDLVYGGDDYDRIVLQGDYSAGLTLSSSFVTGVEALRLFGAYDYNITVSNDFLSGGAQFTVNAPLTGGYSLSFDASAETDANYTIFASAGDDQILTGRGDDKIYLAKGGTDVVQAGFGDDLIVMDGALTASDQIDGGEGFNDQVFLNGDYDGANAVVFNDTTMTAVETLRLANGHNYDLTFADGTVDSFTNLTLVVDARLLDETHFARIDGSAETDSNYTMWGGKGDDTFIGGDFADTLRGHAGDDTLQGGGGLDDLYSGQGDDTFVYTASNESHSVAHDTIHGFNSAHDSIQTTIAVTSMGTPPIGPKTVNFATFDTDMGNAISDALIGHQAIVIDVTNGDYTGHSFLVVDANANGSYDSTDYLMDISGYNGALTAANFTT